MTFPDVAAPAGERRLLVTGGGSGIGQAVCRVAASHGWPTVAFDRDARALDVTAGETGAASIVGDVTDEPAVELAVDHASELLGGVPNALVTAAGVYEVNKATDTAMVDLQRVLTINTVGSFLFARAVARRLQRSAQSGSLVFLSSMAAQVGDRDEPGVAYCASKGALEAMTRQLAVEWSGDSIRVNAVSPGVIDTPMLRLMDDPTTGEQYLREGVPMERLGTASEVATTCMFLLSEAASYITGVVLPVDGGVTVK